MKNRDEKLFRIEMSEQHSEIETDHCKSTSARDFNEKTNPANMDKILWARYAKQW